MKKHIALLLISLLIVSLFIFLNAFISNYSRSYPILINRGVSLFTSDRVHELSFDEYWLLHKTNQKTGDVPKEHLAYLKNKFKNNPFKRLIDTNDYTKDISFERHENKNENKTGPDYYSINNLPESTTNWDKILLKALYCDKSGYDSKDFRILSLLKSNKGDYHDTHYLLGLIFLRENNCFKKDVVENEISRTAGVIQDVQNKDKEFSDLYAERIVLLFWAGFGKDIKKDWIDLIVKSFDKEYGWYDRSSPGFNSHATPLSLLSLIYYAEGKEKQPVF